MELGIPAIRIPFIESKMHYYMFILNMTVEEVLLIKDIEGRRPGSALDVVIDKRKQRE